MASDTLFSDETAILPADWETKDIRTTRSRLRTETWLYEYLSSPNPQVVLPSRLKKEYQMPSYATLPEGERHLLAQYLASLKVKDWYFDQTKKAEYEKLTGVENNK